MERKLADPITEQLTDNLLQFLDITVHVDETMLAIINFTFDIFFTDLISEYTVKECQNLVNLS
uniref:Uncharacterized protein n=1 Tax=Arion vulgaris TaxID=1028688 RepID=A0A0B6ZLK1_9EUPU